VDQPIHRPVVRRDREQVRDAHEDDEQVAREAEEDVVLRNAVPTPNAAASPSTPMLMGIVVATREIATRTSSQMSSLDM
jgi:hypothetical protein